MDKNLAKQKILLLREELEYHNQLYYNEHKNEISDYEYDQKINNLIDLEKKFPEFNSMNSPSIRVGGKITKEFKTIKNLLMLNDQDRKYQMLILKTDNTSCNNCSCICLRCAFCSLCFL